MMHKQKKGVGSYVAVPVEGCALVVEGFFVAGFVSFGLVIKSSSIKIGSFGDEPTFGIEDLVVGGVLGSSSAPLFGLPEGCKACPPVRADAMGVV